jgi:hypothetical protein
LHKPPDAYGKTTVSGLPRMLEYISDIRAVKVLFHPESADGEGGMNRISRAGFGAPHAPGPEINAGGKQEAPGLHIRHYFR